MRPNFKRDSKREKIVGDFLDKRFYDNEFESYRRVRSRIDQLKGVDVKGIRNGEELLVDEKAATSWAHREINTFAFELSFLIGEREYKGWFNNSDNKLETTHWLLAWPRAKNEEINSINDIQNAEIFLVKCEIIRNWINKMKMKETKTLDNVVTELRNDTDINQVIWSNLRIIISRKMNEQPINILIPKDILRHLSGNNNWML